MTINQTDNISGK